MFKSPCTPPYTVPSRICCLGPGAPRPPPASPWTQGHFWEEKGRLTAPGAPGNCGQAQPPGHLEELASPGAICLGPQRAVRLGWKTCSGSAQAHTCPALRLSAQPHVQAETQRQRPRPHPPQSRAPRSAQGGIPEPTAGQRARLWSHLTTDFTGLDLPFPSQASVSPSVQQEPRLSPL